MRVIVRSAISGFTLVEVLIALAITAVIGVIAYTAVTISLAASESQLAQIDRLNEISGFYNRLAQDLRQALPRGVRDEYGDMEQPVLGGMEQENFLTLTRSGWQNFNAPDRSRLQRVTYSWRDRKIFRSHWHALDRVADSKKVEYAVLPGVEAVQIRFLELQPSIEPGSLPELEWRDDWNKTATRALPMAIEVVLEVEGFGQLRRLIEVPVDEI